MTYEYLNSEINKYFYKDDGVITPAGMRAALVKMGVIKVNKKDS